MSDLHGCYSQYKKMLELINFDDGDQLYILGDIVDRGPKPISIIMDILERKNITVLLGNHEMYAREVLKETNSYIDEISEEFYSKEIRNKYFIWQVNGGGSTFDEFYPLSIKEQKRVVEFLENLPYYIDVEVNGKRFSLVHAGINNYTTDENRELLDAKDFVLQSPTSFESPPFIGEDRYLVFGHTPTFRIADSKAKPGNIFIKNNYIGIDCGAVFSSYGGRLGCLRLNDMKEFYI